MLTLKELSKNSLQGGSVNASVRYKKVLMQSFFTYWRVVKVSIKPKHLFLNVKRFCLFYWLLFKKENFKIHILMESIMHKTTTSFPGENLKTFWFGKVDEILPRWRELLPFTCHFPSALRTWASVLTVQWAASSQWTLMVHDLGSRSHDISLKKRQSINGVFQVSILGLLQPLQLLFNQPFP